MRDQPLEDRPDYALDDDEGNGRLDVLVREVMGVVHAGGADRREVLVALADGVRELAASHPEVTGTATRVAIVRELTPAFEQAGWEMPDPFEF